jgi:hypothetical protein
MHSKFAGITGRNAPISAENVPKLPLKATAFAPRLRHRQFCMQNKRQVNSKCGLEIEPSGARSGQPGYETDLYLALSRSC